jgi:hypothetical protein
MAHRVNVVEAVEGQIRRILDSAVEGLHRKARAVGDASHQNTTTPGGGDHG